jgi:hypothetical protein
MSFTTSMLNDCCSYVSVSSALSRLAAGACQSVGRLVMVGRVVGNMLVGWQPVRMLLAPGGSCPVRRCHGVPPAHNSWFMAHGY